MTDDVPSPIDLRDMDDARAWQASAMGKRPCRSEFFAQFAAAIQSSGLGAPRVLELGSGPAFLAEHLLKTIPSMSYSALDFSAAMHILATARLGALNSKVRFIERDFKTLDWTRGLEQFDFVISMQAVHELRHKRYAATLHGQVRTLLSGGGSYLVCDHFLGLGGMANHQLYMTVQEQRQSLQSRVSIRRRDFEPRWSSIASSAASLTCVSSAVMILFDLPPRP